MEINGMCYEMQHDLSKKNLVSFFYKAIYFLE